MIENLSFVRSVKSEMHFPLRFALLEIDREKIPRSSNALEGDYWGILYTSNLHQ
jgi:hypothetical protein